MARGDMEDVHLAGWSSELLPTDLGSTEDVAAQCGAPVCKEDRATEKKERELEEFVVHANFDCGHDNLSR